MQQVSQLVYKALSLKSSIFVNTITCLPPCQLCDCFLHVCAGLFSFFFSFNWVALDQLLKELVGTEGKQGNAQSLSSLRGSHYP